METGGLLTPPAPISGRHRVARYAVPTWSPDGRYVAFTAQPTGDGSSAPQSIVVRSMATGESREIVPDLGYFSLPTWSHDGRSFLLSGQDPRGRNGFYRVDGVTGAVTVIQRDSRPQSIQRAADGKTVYYADRYQPGRPGVFEHDLESGELKGIYVPPRPVGPEEASADVVRRYMFQGVDLSPDGSRVALISYFWDTILVVDTNGGTPRELFQEAAINGRIGPVRTVRWSSDGRHVFFTRPSSAGHGAELWRVPAEGGEAELVTADFPALRGWSLHPDGRQILYPMGESRTELWVMKDPTGRSLGAVSRR